MVLMTEATGVGGARYRVGSSLGSDIIIVMGSMTVSMNEAMRIGTDWRVRVECFFNFISGFFCYVPRLEHNDI
jgi:hypothetical protein